MDEKGVGGAMSAVEW